MIIIIFLITLFLSQQYLSLALINMMSSVFDHLVCASNPENLKRLQKEMNNFKLHRHNLKF